MRDLIKELKENEKLYNDLRIHNTNANNNRNGNNNISYDLRPERR